MTELKKIVVRRQNYPDGQRAEVVSSLSSRQLSKEEADALPIEIIDADD